VNILKLEKLENIKIIYEAGEDYCRPLDPTFGQKQTL